MALDSGFPRQSLTGAGSAGMTHFWRLLKHLANQDRFCFESLAGFSRKTRNFIIWTHGAFFIVVTQMTTNHAQVRRINQRLFGNNRKLKI